MTDCKHCKRKFSVDRNLVCRGCGKRQISVWQTNPLMGIIVIFGLLGVAEEFFKWLKHFF